MGLLLCNCGLLSDVVLVLGLSQVSLIFWGERVRSHLVKHNTSGFLKCVLQCRDLTPPIKPIDPEWWGPCCRMSTSGSSGSWCCSGTQSVKPESCNYSMPSLHLLTQGPWPDVFWMPLQHPQVWGGWFMLAEMLIFFWLHIFLFSLWEKSNIDALGFRGCLSWLSSLLFLF